MSEDSSSKSSSPPDSSLGTEMEANKELSRKADENAEMLQLTLQAISTYKATQKELQSESKIPTVSSSSSADVKIKKIKKRLLHPERDSAIDKVGNSSNVKPSQSTNYIHPLLRRILASQRKPVKEVDYSILPLHPPQNQPQPISQMNDYHESSSEDEYNPDDLTGEGAFKCYICCEVFETQSLSNQHMLEERHIRAHRLMTLVGLDYCYDIDLIVKLREKMKLRNDKKIFLQSADRTESESEDEKELQRMENSYASNVEKRAMKTEDSSTQPVPVINPDRVQPVSISLDVTTIEGNERKAKRKRIRRRNKVKYVIS